MRVINLQAWAGENFSYVAGDVIDLPDAVANGRIRAGLAAPVAAEQSELPLGVGEKTKQTASRKKNPK